MKEANIGFVTEITVGSVVEFIKNNKRIETLHLHVQRGSLSFIKGLNKTLGNDWKIKNLNDDTYSEFVMEKRKVPIIVTTTENPNVPTTAPTDGETVPPPTTPKPDNSNGVSPATISFVLLVFAYCLTIV